MARSRFGWISGFLRPSTPCKHHDLDNYLFPLVTRLGPRRFASVWGTKGRAPHSSIRVDTARRAAEGLRATLYRVRATRSAQTAAWKEEIRDQLLGAAEIADGPVKLELSLRVGPGRNWANLWKPAIDSLGPILGSEGSRPWNPRDGRVVQLGLHQEVDASLGHAVEIAVDAESVASPSRLATRRIEIQYVARHVARDHPRIVETRSPSVVSALDRKAIRCLSRR